MKIKPCNDGILIKCPKIEETTKSGVIKDKATLKSEKEDLTKPFEVVEVAPKVEGLKTGDYIYLKSNAHLIELPVDVPSESIVDESGNLVTKDYCYCVVALHMVLCLVEQ